jgi:hypothetical protein
LVPGVIVGSSDERHADSGLPLRVRRVSFLFEMIDDEAQLAHRIAGWRDNPDTDAGREGGKT